ncbi:hypothetical protein JKY72_02395 [Candidatus Gracilibacteria bacterium]|nr:hypothetical protein [Candidatus Gracilibacteria bacterium]
MQEVKTNKAPAAIGSYSQAVKSGGFVFCSGQIALKADGELLEGDIREQAAQVLENLTMVLDEAGSSMSKVVKTTIYLKDMGDFAVVNEIYASFFTGEIKPARATVEVSYLPKRVAIEIDCIAEL